VAGAVYLIVASTRGTAWHIVSCSIFAGTLVLVYLCSTSITRCADAGASCLPDT